MGGNERADQFGVALEGGQMKGRQTDARFAVDEGLAGQQCVANDIVTLLGRQVQCRHAV